MKVTLRKVAICFALATLWVVALPGTPTAKSQVKERFSIVGEVKTPGEYSLSANLTVKQAVDTAGLTDRGRLEYTVIFRRIGDGGERREIEIDLKSVTTGSKEDIRLIAGDIVLVPNSNRRIPLGNN